MKLPLSSSHYLKNLKQQDHDRQIIEIVIDLINDNDHDTLAFLARTTGIPPQLRHVVWPILLKYNPMCISPNIVSNVITWDNATNTYQLVEKTESVDSTMRHLQNGTEQESDPDSVERLVMHDLQKYFHLRINPISDENQDDAEKDTLHRDDELQVIKALKEAIMHFLKKWSMIFKYESGIAWIALGLAEWVPPIPVVEEPVVLNGRRHTHKKISLSNNNSSATLPNGNPNSCMEDDEQDCNISKLYKEYPLPQHLKDRLPKEYQFSFNDLFERLLLVILHSPDTLMAKSQIQKEFPSNSTHLSNYIPILSGGDLSFQTQTFFKVFSSILPELYQPLTDESTIQPNSSRATWLYWWIKCSGARALQRQDRARIWDILLGWRPKPNMNAINFFLNYNTKLFDHLYKPKPAWINGNVIKKRTNLDFLKKLIKNDPFWFPDLNSIDFGNKDFPYDYNVLKGLLLKNKYDKNPKTASNSLPPSSNSSSSSSLSQIATGLEFTGEEDVLPYSLIDPHIQLIFIYMAIFQYNEFRLLEFEETEISEFLNNVPMLSKADDKNFKQLYDTPPFNKYTVYSTQSNNASNDEIKRPPMPVSGASSSSSASNGNITSTTNQMFIELGNDAKASHSFNDILNIAGDIWRKWFWNELEENIYGDIE